MNTGSVQDIEDTRQAAERIRSMLRSLADGVDHKLTPDYVEVSGFGFVMTIDGEHYVVCVEKV